MKPPYCKLKGQISCKNLNHFFQSERTQTLEVELPAEVNYTIYIYGKTTAEFRPDWKKKKTLKHSVCIKFKMEY